MSSLTQDTNEALNPANRGISILAKRGITKSGMDKDEWDEMEVALTEQGKKTHNCIRQWLRQFPVQHLPSAQYDESESEPEESTGLMPVINQTSLTTIFSSCKVGERSTFTPDNFTNLVWVLFLKPHLLKQRESRYLKVLDEDFPERIESVKGVGELYADLKKHLPADPSRDELVAQLTATVPIDILGKKKKRAPLFNTTQVLQFENLLSKAISSKDDGGWLHYTTRPIEDRSATVDVPCEVSLVRVMYCCCEFLAMYHTQKRIMEAQESSYDNDMYKEQNYQGMNQLQIKGCKFVQNLASSISQLTAQYTVHHGGPIANLFLHDARQLQAYLQSEINFDILWFFENCPDLITNGDSSIFKPFQIQEKVIRAITRPGPQLIFCISPPGTGKTAMAAHLPSIFPHRTVVFVCAALPVVQNVGQIACYSGTAWAFVRDKVITPNFITCGRDLGHFHSESVVGKTAIEALRNKVDQSNAERKTVRRAQKKRNRALHNVKRFPSLFLVNDPGSVAWLLKQLKKEDSVLVIDEPPMMADVMPLKPEDAPVPCAMAEAMMQPAYKTLLMSATMPRVRQLPTIVRNFLRTYLSGASELRECTNEEYLYELENQPQKKPKAILSDSDSSSSDSDSSSSDSDSSSSSSDSDSSSYSEVDNMSTAPVAIISTSNFIRLDNGEVLNRHDTRKYITLTSKQREHIAECFSSQLDAGVLLVGPEGSPTFPHSLCKSADELSGLVDVLPTTPLIMKSYTERAISGMIQQCYKIFQVQWKPIRNTTLNSGYSGLLSRQECSTFAVNPELAERDQLSPHELPSLWNPADRFWDLSWLTHEALREYAMDLLRDVLCWPHDKLLRFCSSQELKLLPAYDLDSLFTKNAAYFMGCTLIASSNPRETLFRVGLPVITAHDVDEIKYLREYLDLVERTSKVEQTSLGQSELMMSRQHDRLDEKAKAKGVAVDKMLAGDKKAPEKKGSHPMELGDLVKRREELRTNLMRCILHTSQHLASFCDSSTLPDRRVLTRQLLRECHLEDLLNVQFKITAAERDLETKEEYETRIDNQVHLLRLLIRGLGVYDSANRLSTNSVYEPRFLPGTRSVTMNYSKFVSRHMQSGGLACLCAGREFTWGANIPASTVIVTDEFVKDTSVSGILQYIGRCARRGLTTHGQAVFESHDALRKLLSLTEGNMIREADTLERYAYWIENNCDDKYWRPPAESAV